MSERVERTEEPQERLTRLADAAVNGLEGHPEWGDDVRGVFMLATGERIGSAVFGYDANSVDPLADLIEQLQALFRAHGKTLAFMTEDELRAGPN